MRLVLTCFGGFQVMVDHQSSTFATNPARALLIYLALEASTSGTRAHHRETLAGLLWPDYLESAARLNLSQTLVRLRRAINDHQAIPPFLQINRQTIQLDPALVTVDVWHFQQLIAACLAHPHAEPARCPTCCARLVEATDLYQGSLLAGQLWTDSRPFEEWLLLKREQVQRLALDALHTLAVHHEAMGAYDQAQHYAQRQLALEPWREAAHRQLIRSLALAGKRGAALAHYESCRRSLRTELDIEPDVATVALVEQIRQKNLRFTIDVHEVSAKRHLRLPSHHPEIVNRHSSIVNHLDPPPDQQLFGIAAAPKMLVERLCAPRAPWLLAIDGIGGIGKTTLATVLVHDVAASERFVNIAWVSARQTEFQPATSLQTTERPALDVETLTTMLLEQLLEQPIPMVSSREKQAMLTQLLKAQPYLIVVDNLETMVDYTALVPFLRQLTNPSKFLLTSRMSLQGDSGVYCYTLHEWTEADALAFLRHEAEMRGIQALIDARQAQLQRIYQVVGGNPLALKLVLGQVRFLPLAQVLANLQEAQGKPVQDLYAYIYWQAWQLLEDAGRRLLLVLPVESNSTYAQLAALDLLEPEQLRQALAQLLALSLVQVGGDLEQPRYLLHRLTETFLLREVVQWLTPIGASPTM